MAEAEQVTHLPRPLPQEIVVAQQITPNEMRELKRETGRTLTDILGGDPEDMDRAPDRLQSLVWVALRRAGYEVTWDQAGDTAAVVREPEPDPTPTGS
jgi:hypothetical protein